MLRERIWNHLTLLTRTKRTTVLLSTHYFHEASQADCVGLMRNGVLIAEDSPKNIVAQVGTNSFEEAIFELSLKQEKFGNPQAQLGKVDYSSAKETFEVLKETKNRKPEVMRALITKNFIQFFRSHLLVSAVCIFVVHVLYCISRIFALWFPAILCFTMKTLVEETNHFNLVLGVVTDEISSIDECSSSTHFVVNQSRCFQESVSCAFLHKFQRHAEIVRL
jgi:ABC-type proline/glycine betaine transport system ATPase subunit